MRSARIGGIVLALLACMALAIFVLPKVLGDRDSGSEAKVGSSDQTSAKAPASDAAVVPTVAPELPPLTGELIIIDPGHQLGNSRHPREINKQVPAGNGTMKACNTTGTSTNDGYAEATFTFGVAAELKQQLKALGATVEITRDSDSVSQWGPCVDVRGTTGNGQNAAAKISIHGDGSGAQHHGFHIIVSTVNKDLKQQSTTLAEQTVKALEDEGFSRSNYIGKGTALSLRPDIATVNLSEMPTIMTELGNMRNVNDAEVMKSDAGKKRYATALANALLQYLSER